MGEVVLNILIAPVVILLYGSGLLLWPLRRWRLRGQKVRGKALGFVFVAQVIACLAVACCSMFIRLEHFYYWFIFLIELNIVFTIVGLFAWARDKRYERLVEAAQTT